ncbi:MAG: Spy/CpxP family protein refolding chaperone [Burkholderiaceae bacterium]
MKNHWLKHFLAGATASAALLCGVAAAQGGLRGGPPSDARMAAHEARLLERIGRELNLDADQSAKLQALGAQLKAQRAAMMDGGARPGDRMKALIAGGTFDRAGAQQLVDEKVAQIKANSPALIAAAGDFFDSLNAAQQQQVRDFAARHPRGRGPQGHGRSPIP